MTGFMKLSADSKWCFFKHCKYKKRSSVLDQFIKIKKNLLKCPIDDTQIQAGNIDSMHILVKIDINGFGLRFKIN